MADNFAILKDENPDIPAKPNATGSNWLYHFAAEWDMRVTPVGDGTTGVLTGTFKLWVKPQTNAGSNQRGCWTSGRGGSVYLTINGETVAGVSPNSINAGMVHTPICTRRASTGFNDKVEAFTVTNLNLNINIPANGMINIPVHFECWHGQTDPTCGHSGVSGSFNYSSHEGPTGDIDIQGTLEKSGGPLPLHIIYYYNGTADNTGDGTLIDPVTYASVRFIANDTTTNNSFTETSGHYLMPAIDSTPQWAPSPDSLFDGWKISETANPTNYAWGQNVAPYGPPGRQIRFVAKWKDPVGIRFTLFGSPPEGGNPTFTHNYTSTPPNPPIPSPSGVGTHVFDKKDITIGGFTEGTNGPEWGFDRWASSNVGPETGSISPPGSFVLKDKATVTAYYKKIPPEPIKVGGKMWNCNIDTVWPMTYDSGPVKAIGIGWVDHPSYPEQEIEMYTCEHSKEVPAGTDEDGNTIYETVYWDEEHAEQPPSIILRDPIPWINEKGKDPPGHTSANGLCTSTGDNVVPRAGYIFHGWQKEKLGGAEVNTGDRIQVGTGMACTGTSNTGSTPFVKNEPTFYAKWERVVNVFVNRGSGPSGPWHLHSVTRINSGGWQRKADALKQGTSWVDPFGRLKNFS